MGRDTCAVVTGEVLPSLSSHVPKDMVLYHHFSSRRSEFNLQPVVRGLNRHISLGDIRMKTGLPITATKNGSRAREYRATFPKKSIRFPDPVKSTRFSARGDFQNS